MQEEKKILSAKSLEIKNLASFNGTAEEINGFDQLNVLIGRNNQGKSNLLKAIQFLDYNNLISFLHELPDSTKKFDELRSIGSPRGLLSMFNYKSSNFLDAHFKEPIEISYTLEVDKELHTYEIRIESLVWKEKGIFRYIDGNGIYRDSREPVATFYDGEKVTLNEVLGNSEGIVYPIKFSTIDHNFDFDKMKDDLLKISYEDRKERVEILLAEMQELSSDFHKLFLAFGDYVFPRDASGRDYREVEKQIYDEKLFLNAELFLDRIGLTSAVLGSGQKQVLALLYELDVAEMAGASIITIDEMELHLYPALQKSVLNKIKDRSKKQQFFISTHSNILISTPLDQKNSS